MKVFLQNLSKKGNENPIKTIKTALLNAIQPKHFFQISYCLCFSLFSLPRAIQGKPDNITTVQELQAPLTMVIRVVQFSSEGYKIRKISA